MTVPSTPSPIIVSADAEKALATFARDRPRTAIRLTKALTTHANKRTIPHGELREFSDWSDVLAVRHFPCSPNHELKMHVTRPGEDFRRGDEGHIGAPT